MFNSSVIDVAIGLVFVFLLLSLIASAVKEGLEAMFKQRAKELERGIKELVGDVDTGKQGDGKATGKDQSDGTTSQTKSADALIAQKFVASLYDHGLINSLFKGTYGTTKKNDLPSYIPSKNFALALLDLWRQESNATPAVELPSHVKQALRAFTITAGTDLTKMQALIEDWYNTSMDRVAGWYKRRTQWWLIGIGLVITIVVNADSIEIVKRLSTDKTLREAVVTAAQKELTAPPQTTPTPAPGTPATSTTHPAGTSAPSAAQTSGNTQSTTASGSKDSSKSDPPDQELAKSIKKNLTALDGVGLPIGWSKDLDTWNTEIASIKGDTKCLDKIVIYAKATWHLRLKAYPHIPGWILTALALSLGAPFWFDMLNKIMVVRSTVKPHEKSKEEGSKDSGK
jgi:hypothetical protein